MLRTHAPRWVLAAVVASLLMCAPGLYVMLHAMDEECPPICEGLDLTSSVWDMVLYVYFDCGRPACQPW